MLYRTIALGDQGDAELVPASSETGGGMAGGVVAALRTYKAPDHGKRYATVPLSRAMAEDLVDGLLEALDRDPQRAIRDAYQAGVDAGRGLKL